MVRCVAFLCITLFLFLFSPFRSHAFRSVLVGGTAPLVSVKTLEGKEVNLSFGQRLAVLIFWREDQSFSLAALRDLEQIRKEFSGKGVGIFAIVEGGASPASVEKTLGTLRISYPVYMDSDHKAEEKYGVIVFPSTGIIGPGGRLKFYLPSRNSNYQEIVRGRLRVELGLTKESEFEQRMEQIGERMGDERFKANEHLKIGLRLSRQGKAGEAIQELRQALGLDPDLTDAHLALGYAYLDTGEIARAQKEFEKVLQRHPLSPSAKVGVGISEVRSGRLDKGIGILKKAVGLNPDPVRGYYELGKAYEQKGDLKQALHAYKWAVRKLLQGRR
ncbi:MAG: tetratricopeptide repeat protein [Candidatus Binatia bacterium]